MAWVDLFSRYGERGFNDFSGQQNARQTSGEAVITYSKANVCLVTLPGAKNMENVAPISEALCPYAPPFV